MIAKQLVFGLAVLAGIVSASAQTEYLIDLDSTVPGSIATEDGWTSLDATLGNDSPGVTLDGIAFTVGSADGSRVREDAGLPNPNALTADFVFDDGAGQAVLLFFGGEGSLPAGEWKVEMWMWDEDAPADEMIVGYRTSNVETIVGSDFVPDPVNPAATFNFVSDGSSAYDVFVRENNSQDRARLNAVRLSKVGASSVGLDRAGVSATAGVSEFVGALVSESAFPSPPYTYSLVAGDGDTHNSEFEIDGEDLQTSATYPGHVAGATLSIRLRVIDAAGGVLETALQLNVVNDSDDDGLDDDWELMFFDNLDEATSLGNNDEDTLNNITEFQRGTSPVDADSDGDNLNDDVEDNDGTFNGDADPGTDPVDPDTDDDGVNDGDELVDGTNPLVADADGDGLNDGQEKAAGTDPGIADSDGDGQTDGGEVAAGSDPLDPADPPAGDHLAAYWPLDTATASDPATTPDASGNGYDLMLNFMSAETNFVTEDGRQGASFNGIDTILTRIHAEEDALPINQHPAFTVAMWVKSVGSGQNDLRYFSEGSTTNTTPLFNLGTHNTGTDGATNLFLRSIDSGNSVNRSTSTEVLDGTWRHVTLTSNGPNQRIAMYIDGVLDRDDIGYIPVDNPDAPLLDTTSVGGIQRDVQSHWFTGFVDDVALWSTVLQAQDIQDLANGSSPLDIGAGGSKFEITSIVRDPDTGAVTLTWNSKPNKTYTIRYKADGLGDPFSWPDARDDIQSQGETTSAVDDSFDPAVTPRRFYRITENPQ